jgi:hypothetical protein
MMFRARFGPLVPAILLSFVVAARPALVHAQGHDSVAESLFAEARTLMKAGDPEAACPKLVESYRLAPAPGTLLNIGICERQRGRLATAWTKLREFVDKVPASDDRYAFAKEQIAALEPRLPHLRIRIPAGTPVGAVVRLDDVELGAASFDTWIAVDPGEHQVTLTAPDGRSGRQFTAAAEGGDAVVEVSLPEPRATKPAPVDPKPVPNAVAHRASPAKSVPPAHGSAHPELKTWGYATLTLGGASLIAALTFGGLALHQKDVLHDNCTGHKCEEAGLTAAERGDRFATISNVAFAVGLASTAAGVFLLWKSAQSGEGTSIAAGPSGVTVTYRGPLL